MWMISMQHTTCTAKFTRAFLVEFDIRSKRARMVLLLIMTLGHTEQAGIECMHAWAHRITKRLGVQTHRPNFYDVSARALVQRMKRRLDEESSVWARCNSANSVRAECMWKATTYLATSNVPACWRNWPCAVCSWWRRRHDNQMALVDIESHTQRMGLTPDMCPVSKRQNPLDGHGF